MTGLHLKGKLKAIKITYRKNLENSHTLSIGSVCTFGDIRHGGRSIGRSGPVFEKEGAIVKEKFLFRLNSTSFRNTK